MIPSILALFLKNSAYITSAQYFSCDCPEREFIQGAKFKTPEQARKEIFKYIALYYNKK
ncbi:IS3 family transposase [Bacillus thuringiensis]|uniref:IS3 family transposase n=1 Tax=Bacillus thuringiensis TaxID=1428 RepID=UPI003CFFBDC2